MIEKQHSEFLNELHDWMPWVTKRGEAPSHLKMEFPSLTIEESHTIVNEWLAGKQQLLNETESDSDVGC